MKKRPTLIIAAFTALTLLATSLSAPAHAGKRERQIAAGIILGAIGGAIIAKEINRKRRHKHHSHHNGDYGYEYDNHVRREHRRVNRRVYQQPRLSRWERHVRRCYRKYRSYDERSDTFIDYHGRERRCRL